LSLPVIQAVLAEDAEPVATTTPYLVEEEDTITV
jgi:hypothetical protein